VPLAVARRQRWLLTEYALLFFGLVAACTAIGSPGSPIPFLVVGALVAWLVLRRSPRFDRGALWRPGALRGALPSIVRLWLAAAVVLIAVLAIWSPERLFALPRQQPLFWIAVAVLYPLLSVYPQELIFRAFLLHRYAPVFGRRRVAAAASALAFGFAHIIYGSVVSVVLTVALGALLARRFQRTRSLVVVWVEHSLYGLLAFTAGIDDLFYSGLR
jgi:CAAX protease family protein